MICMKVHVTSDCELYEIDSFEFRPHISTAFIFYYNGVKNEKVQNGFYTIIPSYHQGLCIHIYIDGSRYSRSDQVILHL